MGRKKGMDKNTKAFIIMMVLAFIVATVFVAYTTNWSAFNNTISGDWGLISYGAVENPTLALSHVTASIHFNLDGTLDGNMGCNSFSGKYAVDGNKLTISSLASTEMYCEITSAQETAVLNILSSNGLHFQKNGMYMTISSAIGVINLKMAME